MNTNPTNLVVDSLPTMAGRMTGQYNENQCVAGTQYGFPVYVTAVDQLSTVGYPTGYFIAPAVVQQWSTDNFGGGQRAFPDGSVSYQVPSQCYALGPGPVSSSLPIPVGGIMRCIGQAIEIIDTTPPLYQGGLLTVSRTPSRMAIDEVPFVGGVVINGLSGGSAVNLQGSISPGGSPARWASPPVSIANALAYQSTRQFPVKEGCYAVCAFDMDQNKLSPVSRRHLKQMGSDFFQPSNTTCYPTLYGTATHGLSPIAGANWICYQSNAPSFNFNPIDNTCIYLTGLPPQGTYTVRLRAVYEIAPTATSSFAAFVPMAKRSAEYDPIAIELYQRLIQAAPAGMPFKYNGLGEWFRNVVEGVKKILPTIAGPVASFVKAVVPGSGPIVDAVGGVAHAAGLLNVAAQRAEAAASRATNAIAAVSSASKKKKKKAGGGQKLKFKAKKIKK